MMTLSELDFTDLYIGTGNPREALFRGLRKGAVIAERTSLERGPEEVGQDLEGLVREIIRIEDGRREVGRHGSDFLVIHNGTRYRAARIENDGNDPDERFYCLRKIRSDDLGRLWKEAHPELRRIGEMSLGKRGLLVFSGSFSTGKSRNAAMLANFWAERDREMVVTIEDPPEYNLDRRSGDRGIIAQVDVSSGGLSQQLFNLRRWSPRYIFFGELRSPQMAGALMHMSISGPLCLCTLHAASPTQAVFSLVRFASELMDEQTALEIVGSSLIGIVHHDRIGDRFMTAAHDLSGQDAALLKAKIRAGRPSSVEEELQRRVRAARSGI